MADAGGAYGAGRAGGSFNPLTYILKPEVILRFCALVFSIVVFGCIADKVYRESGYCAYYGNMDCCRFGIAVGVISFVGMIAFLVADAFFELLSNVQHRKYIVIADVSFSCAWGFMWLVCFCFLTDNWRRDPYKYNKVPAEAALAFSFFCLAIFVALAVLAILRLRKGVSEDFSMPSTTTTQPPPYSEGQQPGMTPPTVSSVYNVGDANFSPHPFAGSAAKPPGISDTPAY